MLLTAVPELHKKWEHGTLAGPVTEAPAAVEAAGRPGRGSVVTALLEPPSLAEFEPDHLVAASG
jgi:hypothetical protein